MRIITGKARGVKLCSLEGLETRPTIDRVKEAMFSALQFDLYGAKVLDLFAGSGALGLEALSRGAKEAVLCDASSAAIEVIRKNIASTGLAEGARVMQKDFRRLLMELRGEKPFDIVLLDPPYAAGVYEEATALLCEYELVHRNTRIVMESSAENRPASKLADFVLERSKKFGTVGVNFYRHRLYLEDKHE